MKSLKLIFLLAAFVVAFSSCDTDDKADTNQIKKISSNPLHNPFNGWIKITKKDVGPNGYRYEHITETATYCNIRYEYPGYAKETKLNIHPKIKIVYPYDNMVKAIHYAYKQISLGNLEGQRIMPKTHIRIRWKASSSDTMTADSEVLAW